MGSDLMKSEYTDSKQRLAVCYSSWRKTKEESINKNGLNMKDFKTKIEKVVKIVEQSASNKSWATINKTKLPSSCFLWVEDPKKRSTWHLPYKEGTGGIDSKTGMYRKAGVVNLGAVRAILAALAGARTGKPMRVPTSVRKRVEALAKRFKIGKFKESFFNWGGVAISERFSSLRDQISNSVRAKFGKKYYVVDFSDKEIIYGKEAGGIEVSSSGGEEYQKIGYKVVNGEIEFVGSSEKVSRITTYEMDSREALNLMINENEIGRKF